MKKKILLVGCGNIGSRHLQGIVKINESAEISIVDPSLDSQNLAMERLNEIPFDPSKFDIVWHDSIDDLFESDLVILATPSEGRKDLIKQLITQNHSRFLIEKMACQSKYEYKEIQRLLEQSNSKAWINTTRRYFASYRIIKKLFNESEHVHFSILAGNMGLGSNAIHFVDLFCWLVNNFKITLNGDHLTDKIFDSKRGKNYREFAGKIFGQANSSSFLSINFLPIENIPLTVRVFDENFDLIINETDQTLLQLRGPKNDNLSFKTEFQSDLTKFMIEDIFKNDNCELPLIQNHYIIHKELFRIFNSHIEKITYDRMELCPIT